MITYRNKINMTPGGVPLVINLSQYDDDFSLIFELFSSKGTFTVSSGTTAEIHGTKLDGNGYSASASLSGTTNPTVTVTGNKQMTAIAGSNMFELVLIYSNKELYSANFILEVERTALDKDTLASDSVIRQLVNVVDRTDEILAAAQQMALTSQTVQGYRNEAEQFRNEARNASNSAANILADFEDASEEKLDEYRTAVNNATAQLGVTLDQFEDDVADALQDYHTAVNNAISQFGEMVDDYEDEAAETLQEIKSFTNEKIRQIDEKAAQIVRITTDADTVARQALEKAGNAENEAYETANKLDSIQQKVNEFRLKLESKIDDAFLENGLLYMLADGTVVVGPLGPFAGGGGGGGGGDTNKAVITVTNMSGWLAKTIAASSDCFVTLSWSSIEDEMPTGAGTLRVTVNGVVKTTQQIDQGEVSVNLAKYCSNGSNVCKVQIADIYGNARTINFSITVTPMSISSSFDISAPYQGAISFPYTPVGSLQKTVHFILDGTEIGTQTTSVSGRQMSYTIPAQSHGAHNLRVYFEADIDGEVVRSNELYFEFISIEPLNNTVIIVSSFNLSSVDQYSSIVIPYRVYNPISDQADVSLYINDNLVSTQTVDRTEQSYTYRALHDGLTKFTIVSGTTIKEISFTVNEVDVDVDAETQDLVLYLNAQGRSNNEETRDIWQYENITAQFQNFTWRLDGWQKDSDGIDVMRLVDDARITIPYQIFERDFKAAGKTIEIEFATRQVADYSATILSCWADNMGLKITPQSVIFKGAQTELSTLFKENEHIRLSIVVEKQTENRLILIYINGIVSRAIQYSSGERFSQLNPIGITLGSNDCGIDIYNIRVYDNDLNRMQVLDNWIADTQIGDVMLERYQHNQVYNQSGEVTIATLPSDLPYFILEATELPQYKGDKKTISGSFTVPGNSAKSFTFENCQINVQGTSSAIYYRKNYDLQFKDGFNTAAGNVPNYMLRSNSIPFNRFVLKADVASSESANNTELTMFYHDTCPYRTPAMRANPKVRYGIEGIPIVVFWYNPDDQTTSFLGKYNFNLPKRAPAPYGYSGNMESWEFERNNSANVKFQDDDFVTMAWDELTQTSYPEWYDDFEARFPSDEWRDFSKIKEFLSWVKSTWRDTATNETFAEPIVYRLNTTVTVNSYIQTDNSFTVESEMDNGVETGYKIITFTKDTPAYRLTKFRAEASDYFEIDSAVFYYLFTELFLMIDSRAKNMFLGFDGSEIT